MKEYYFPLCAAPLTRLRHPLPQSGEGYSRCYRNGFACAKAQAKVSPLPAGETAAVVIKAVTDASEGEQHIPPWTIITIIETTTTN